MDAERGQVLLDGVPVIEVGLMRLRRSLAVIPQDPLLLTGTIRENLDPFAERAEPELLEALRRVGLESSLQLDSCVSVALSVFRCSSTGFRGEVELPEPVSGKCIAADVSTDSDPFSWISMTFHVIILENIRKYAIFRIFRRNYQASCTRRVEECIIAHVSMDTKRFASIRINFRVYDRLKFLKNRPKSVET